MNRAAGKRPRPKGPPPFVRATRVARWLEMDVRIVKANVRTGVWAGGKIGGVWHVSRAQFEELKALSNAVAPSPVK